MKGNTGATSLRRTRRAGDPMKTFDALPSPLRQWLAEAALPWSPASVRRIWSRSLAEGKRPEEVLHTLRELELRNLARDKTAVRPGA